MELKWNHQALVALKFESARYIDPKGNRLSLVVSKSSKIWRWQARVNGVPRTLTLGKFPAVGLADARAKAGAIQADHDAGVDVHVKYGAGVAAPDASPEVEMKRAGMTCQQAWDRYIGGLKAGTNVHGKARNKPRTIIEKEGMWKRQWADEIGDTMMNEVTEEVLYDVIQGLRDDGHMGAANSTTRYIKAFFRWAKLEKRATGLRTNPAGKPLYTDYANDGGVNVLLRKNGNIIASTGWSGNLLGTYGSLAFGSAMTTVFDAPAADTYTGNVTVEVVAFRGSTDTGIVNQGDYYTRTLSGSYTNFSFSNLRLKWTFI